MPAITGWLIDHWVAIAYWFGMLALLTWTWHKYDETHREPTGPVSDWFDYAKARQYGQPGVRLDVFDQYDAHNDLDYVPGV